MLMPPERSFVLLPGEGRPIDLGNFGMTVKATGEETAGAFSLLEADEPPGFGPPLHIHRDAAEAFFVLSGEYRIFLGEEEFACPAGSFIYIPLAQTHGFQVGKVPSRKLNLYLPAAMIGYFDELSAMIAEGSADPGAVDAIGRRNGVDVIGPVPEGYV
jgi:mannose-6-phosphate isomerase-like protein (cupin superfamily)